MNFATDTFEFDPGESIAENVNITDDFEKFLENNKRYNNQASLMRIDYVDDMTKLIVKKFNIKTFLLEPTGKFNDKLIETKSYRISSVSELDSIDLKENSILYAVNFRPAYPKIVDGIPVITDEKGYWIIRAA